MGDQDFFINVSAVFIL